MKKILQAIKDFFVSVWRFIDKRIIVPITKLILSITKKFNPSGKKFENWLSKKNTLLFISLFLAITIFVIIDQKIINYSQNSATVFTQELKQVGANASYVYEGIPSTVEITLIGNKTDLFMAEQMSSASPIIDLTGYTEGTHQIDIAYNQLVDGLEYAINPTSVTVVISTKVSEKRSVGMEIINKNSLDPKLIIDSVTLDEEEVTIQGSQDKIDKVASVKARVDASLISKQEAGTYELSVQLIAYDNAGDVVNIEIVPEKIKASVKVTSPSKEIPIKIVPTGDVAFGKAISSITSNSTKVTVYGPNDVISEINSLDVTLDVTDLKNDETEFKVELVKPNGITYMNVSNIAITVKLDTVSSIDIEGVRIDIKNLPNGYTANVTDVIYETVTVSVKGVDSIIKNIKSDDITAYVDLSSISSEGTIDAKVEVEGTDKRATYVSKTPTIKIKISKK